MQYLIVLSALCAVAFGDFVPKLDGRIVGGQETTIEEYPYQVSVRYADQHICGGSIIDTRTILTACHCVHGMDHSQYSIRVGATEHKKGTQYNVSRVVPNKEYDEDTFDNDVAILKLPYSLDFGLNVAPISLQNRNEEVPANTEAFVSGWGVTEEGSQNVPDVLRMVDVKVISEKDCRSKYVDINDITNRMLCAQTIGHDSCQGDSGGPLASNGKIIGVVSWGYGCAQPAYPGVYAKVAAFYEWIKYNQ